MHPKLRLFMSIGSLFSLLSCDKTTTLEEGTFEGQKYTLKSTQSKGFAINYTSTKDFIKLGRLPAIEINANTTDLGGPPYSDDVYGSAPFVYTTEHRVAYRNKQDTAVGDRASGTMLYLSPNRFSKSEFDQYVRFMKLEWPKVAAKYADEPYPDFAYILGLVYGEKKDFEQIFKGGKTGWDAKYYYTIYPDGRINFGDTKTSVLGSVSEEVQMPGKIICLYTYPEHPNYAINLAKLKTYKDSKGKTIPDYFTVIPKERKE